MLEKKYFIGSNDVDFNLDLKLSSLFKIMQDIAVEHAEKLGVGKKKTMDVGLNWVISRIKVEIYKTPKYQQTITVRTHPGKTIKFVFPRYFEIIDENDEVLIRASSTWLVIESASRKLSLNPFPNFELPGEEYETQITQPEKVGLFDSTLVENRKVRFSDTDLNGHMNNTRYIDFITDIHDSAFYKNKRISKIIINYNKELKDNQTVSLYSSHSNPEFIKGEVEGNNIFTVEISYEDR